MEIKLLGDYTVFFKGKKENILVNPTKKILSDSKFDSRIVLFTSKFFDDVDLLNDGKVLVRGPGEYEIGGVEINGYNGEDENTVYRLVVDGISIVILGKIAQELSSKRVERIDSADVLLAPVAVGKEGSFKLVKEWSKKWGVNYLIPLFEDGESLKKFLDAADEEGLEEIDSLKMEKVDLPDGLELKLLKKV
jgi:hypothetical protein